MVSLNYCSKYKMYTFNCNQPHDCFIFKEMFLHVFNPSIFWPSILACGKINCYSSLWHSDHPSLPIGPRLAMNELHSIGNVSFCLRWFRSYWLDVLLRIVWYIPSSRVWGASVSMHGTTGSVIDMLRSCCPASHKDVDASGMVTGMHIMQ